MTLVLGIFSKKHVVLTADGLCRKENPLRFEETLLKIFPLLNLPIAILHHGENVVGGYNNIKEVIDDFSDKRLELINKNSLYEIAELLRDFLDAKAKQRLKDVGGDNVIGFWIAGFSPNKSDPEIWEVWWKGDRNATIIPLPKLVPGGDGKEFIQDYANPPYNPIGKYNFNAIDSADVDYLIGYHDELYNLAVDEQRKIPKEQKEPTFGGHKHQLVISKSWRWIIPPSK
jgi:hypothetical protein